MRNKVQFNPNNSLFSFLLISRQMKLNICSGDVLLHHQPLSNSSTHSGTWQSAGNTWTKLTTEMSNATLIKTTATLRSLKIVVSWFWYFLSIHRYLTVNIVEENMDSLEPAASITHMKLPPDVRCELTWHFPKPGLGAGGRGKNAWGALAVQERAVWMNQCDSHRHTGTQSTHHLVKELTGAYSVRWEVHNTEKGRAILPPCTRSTNGSFVWEM